jgi:uncharacterized cupin superfamily protein
MTEALLRIDTLGEAEHGSPPADRIASGSPHFTTWNVEERGGLHCAKGRGIPGRWRIAYDEWEYCRILEGVSIVTEDGGDALEMHAGDSFILRPGFRGTWEVVETTVKEYVIQIYRRRQASRCRPRHGHSCRPRRLGSSRHETSSRTRRRPACAEPATEDGRCRWPSQPGRRRCSRVSSSPSDFMASAIR